MSEPVTLSRAIQAVPEAVYRAFTTSFGLQDWCADAAGLDARPGGHLFLWTDSGYQLIGTVHRLDENECVEWDVQSPHPGRLVLRIKPSDEHSRIALSFQGGSDLEHHLAFWNLALDNLKALLETGLDRRVYDRPMLGILVGGMLDEETSRKYRLPVPYGLLLTGTVPGMGAEALGLVENDVIVELGEVALENYPAFRTALEAHKAGDEIRAAWYRDGERQEGLLRLSGRPEPFVPATPAELAEHVRGIYDRLDAELAELLDDATEAEADYRPGEKEWSIKEIIAHTIITERGVQAWIAAALEGTYLKEWGSNDHSVIRSVVDVFPTLPDLTGELHRTERQTVALARRLPPEIVTHRGTYTNIVTMLGEHGLPVHTRMHYETIRGQLEAVRERK